MRKPSLVSALRHEVRRLAAREVKKALKALRRVERRIVAVSLEARAQEKALAKVERKIGRVVGRRRLPPGTTVTPAEVQALRSRLGLSRLKFARLLGVSQGSIFGWERGTSVPRQDSVARLLEIRDKAGRKAPGRSGKPSGRRRTKRR